MVLGLAGAALPPRTRRAPLGSGACGRTSLPAVVQHVPSMVRVHSSSGLVGLPSALHVGAGQPAADAVETPCGDAPQPLQPAASDHSQMLHGSDRRRTQQEDAVESGEQQQQQQQEAVRSGEQQQQQQQEQEQQKGLQTSLAQLVSEALHQPDLWQLQAQQQPAVASGPAAAVVECKRQGSKQAASEQQAQQVGGTRPKRTRMAAAAAGTAACPSAKRRKTSGAGGGSSGGGARVSSAQRHKNSQYADVLHRTVVVPGVVFYVDTPGQVYIGRVNKAESGRRVPSVEVQFQDDGARYWFPVTDVRSWMADMVANGCWQEYNLGIPPPDAHAAAAGAAAAAEGEAEEEAAAAQALQSLSVSMASSRRAGQAASDSVQQPAVSSRVQRRDSRTQQRGQSRRAGAGAGEGAAPMRLLASTAGAGSPSS